MREAEPTKDEAAARTGLLARMDRWQTVTSVGLAIVAFALLALAIPVPVGEGAVGRAARFGHIEGKPSGSVRTTLDDVGGDSGTVAVPMVVGAEVIGVLEVAFPPDAVDPDSTMRVLEALATQAATAVGAWRAIWPPRSAPATATSARSASP